MRIPNHAEGFANQWGFADWISADDLSEGFWSFDTSDEDASFESDPLFILIAAEEANV